MEILCNMENSWFLLMVTFVALVFIPVKFPRFGMALFMVALAGSLLAIPFGGEFLCGDETIKGLQYIPVIFALLFVVAFTEFVDQRDLLRDKKSDEELRRKYEEMKERAER